MPNRRNVRGEVHGLFGVSVRLIGYQSFSGVCKSVLLEHVRE